MTPELLNASSFLHPIARLPQLAAGVPQYPCVFAVHGGRSAGYVSARQLEDNANMIQYKLTWCRSWGPCDWYAEICIASVFTRRLSSFLDAPSFKSCLSGVTADICRLRLIVRTVQCNSKEATICFCDLSLQFGILLNPKIVFWSSVVST